MTYSARPRSTRRRDCGTPRASRRAAATVRAPSPGRATQSWLTRAPMALISPLALLRAVLRGHTRGVVSAAFSEWRGLLFTAGLDSSIHVWSALSETIIATLRAHTAPLVEIVDMTGAPYVASADANRLNAHANKIFFCMLSAVFNFRLQIRVIGALFTPRRTRPSQSRRSARRSTWAGKT